MPPPCPLPGPARCARLSPRGCLCPQDTDFEPDIEEIGINETTTFEAPIEVAIYYVAEVMKSDVVTIKAADGAEKTFADVFKDVDVQSGFMASVTDSFFKKAAYKKFPGGQFSCLAVSPDTEEPGAGLKVWGQLWLSPAFTIDDLFNYYKSFGCAVTVQALAIVRG